MIITTVFYDYTDKAMIEQFFEDITSAGLALLFGS